MFHVYRFCMLIVLIVSCRAKATAVRDGLKLWCRLNENGELETIPGACKDGYVRHKPASTMLYIALYNYIS